MSALCRLLAGNFTIYQTNLLLQRICMSQLSSVSGDQKPDRTFNKATVRRINHWLTLYEDVVGLTEVREAQSKVIQAESTFMDAQRQRRYRQDELSKLQRELRSITAEREKASRVDDNYIDLITKEHTTLREENDIIITIKTIEVSERECFMGLSAALRESHEKERTRTERMKYWSIIVSFLGIVIGVVGSTLNKHLQMRELRKVVTETYANSQDYRLSVGTLLETADVQRRHIDDFLGEVQNRSDKREDRVDRKQPRKDGSDFMRDDILSEIRGEHASIRSEICSLKALMEQRNQKGGEVVVEKNHIVEDIKAKSRIPAKGVDENKMLDKTEPPGMSLASHVQMAALPSDIRREEYFKPTNNSLFTAAVFGISFGLALFFLK